MDSGHDEKRMNAEGDRLSNLPDDIIHNILSFLEITQAIETSELSSRWRYMWTSMPSLSFSSEKFHSLPEFSKFVTNVLSRRNDQIDLSYVMLTFREKICKMIVKRISNYMFSHNVQQLNIIYNPEKKIKSQLPVLISQSLQNLSLTGAYERPLITTPHTWELPALTILYLYGVTFHYDNTDKSDGLFSNCANLKILTISECKITGLDVFNICHPGLSNLTLENGYRDVNVVAPQLKNLIIKDWGGIRLISVPNLSSFSYRTDGISLELCDDLLHLEKVDICLPYISTYYTDAQKVVRLLQQIHSVRSLTLNSEIIEFLSPYVELISSHPSPFANLKSLKIYTYHVHPRAETQPEASMATEVKNFLLDSSPGATLTIVSHEEIRAGREAVIAYRLMREMQVVLDRTIKSRKTDTDDVLQNKATVHDQVETENHRGQPDTKTKSPFGERMTHIKCYWEEMNKQLEKNHIDTLNIASSLQRIEEIITKLPTSHREKLQARFSRLCAEADTIMDDMMDRMKMQCDKKPSRPNIYFHELATSLNPSS